MNLTLVAFYGSKPDPLLRLVDVIQTALQSEVGSVFIPYAMEQIHATIVGLEGWRIGADVFNSNTVQASGETSVMDLHGLLQFIKEMPTFHIRIGGFAGASIYPFTSRGLHPYARSFTLNGPLAVMMGWPVAGGSYPMTLYSLRRECRRYNVLHKYHRKEDDIDNDFFLVLGRVDRKLLLGENAESVEESLRHLLAERKPLEIVIRPDDLSVVAYTDTQLPISSCVKYSLDEALARVEEIKLLYSDHAN